MNFSALINSTVITGILKWALGLLGAWLIQKGYTDNAGWAQLGGDALALATFAWQIASSMINHTNKSAIANSGAVVNGSGSSAVLTAENGKPLA